MDNSLRNAHQSGAKTIEINWSERKIRYAFGPNKTIEVTFLEPSKYFDTFEWCVIIALTQTYCTKTKSAKWTGANETLFDIFKHVRNWTFSYSSLTANWSVIRTGKITSKKLATFIVKINNEQLSSAAKDSAGTSKLLLKQAGAELFQISKGDAYYYLGERQSVGHDQYRYLSADIINPDEHFNHFQAEVSKIFESHEFAAILNKERTLVEFIPQIADSDYDFENLLTTAKQSILIAGQNLYTITYGERSFVTNILEWFAAGEDRKLRLILCDPTSNAAVEYYSLVYGEAFTEHLCQSITRLKEWQKRFSKYVFTVQVTQAVPSSMTVVDYKTGNDAMVITPMLFEPRASLKPYFLLNNAKTSLSLSNIYGLYNQRFISPLITRDLDQVTDEEIEACRRRAKEDGYG